MPLTMASSSIHLLLLLLVQVKAFSPAVVLPSHGVLKGIRSTAFPQLRISQEEDASDDIKHSIKNKEFTGDDQRVLEEIMRARRDVRGNRFDPNKAVPPSVINQILEAASCAPSVGFSQPWEFVFVDKHEIRQQIVSSFEQANKKAKAQFEASNEQDAYARLKLEGIMEAPVNIAVFYRPLLNGPVLGQTSMVEMGRYSVVCAVQNIWLAARALNVGVGWVSILDPNDVKAALNAPEEVELVAYLCLGYVKEGMFLDQPELETLKWRERKPIETCVFRDTYS